MNFAQCVTGAWVDAWRITRRSPLFIALLVAGVYFLDLERSYVRSAHANTLPTYAALGVLWALQALLLSIAIVQMHRFVVLDEPPVSRHAFLGGAYWRHVVVTYGLSFLAIVVGIVACFAFSGLSWAIQSHGPGRGGVAVFAVVLAWVYAWLSARISLINTQASLGRPLRWRAAWRDTRGNARKIYGTLCVLGVTGGFAALPVILLVFAIAAIFGRNSLHAVAQLFEDLFAVWFALLVAACSAWIYRRFAAELL
ncbi:hypothetical protein [Paraburkholderia acidisoli]|uniref:Uncharacterized protein n=1 Tax=Paraburkholderia acidisoli TaxID=2571748 RepID=A0A7Z2GP48_9BURK|nr:hypothetical protein [Paraburkholderia acidisoli]QGZ65338.1 hypothetical protein FAZ98_26590 [Paraburkholderia acidisoli]